MRKVLPILLLTVALTTACNSRQHQAEKLAQEAAMKQLGIDEGYEADETTLDSVFGPEEDTAVMDEAQVLVRLNAMCEEVSQLKNASQSEAESNQYASLIDSIVNTAVGYSIDFMRRLEKPREFVGFRVRQHYSCTQNDSTSHGTMVVYLDKEMSRATRVFELPAWEAVMRSVAASKESSDAIDKAAQQNK